MKRTVCCLLLLLLSLTGLCACGEQNPSKTQIIYQWEAEFYDQVEEKTFSDDLSLGSVLLVGDCLVRKNGDKIQIEHVETETSTIIERPYQIYTASGNLPVATEPIVYYYDYADERYKTAVKVHQTDSDTFLVYYIDGLYYSDKIVPVLIPEARWNELFPTLDEIAQNDLNSSYRYITAEEADGEFPYLQDTAYYRLRTVTTRQASLIDRALRIAGYSLEEMRKTEINAGYQPTAPDVFILVYRVTIGEQAELSVEYLEKESYITNSSAYRIIQK